MGQGHATRLVKWGLEQADASGARIYLEATCEGAPIYKRHGWKAVEELSWNLDDYGIDDAGDGEGKIKLLLMVREPASARR